LYQRAMDALDGRAPVLRIYGDPPPLAEPDPAPSVDRLRAAGVTESEARWIADNRAERHDAAFDSLPIQRTELHLRRYLLASRFASGARVIDAACGTGYGCELLAEQGAASVLGLDIDPQTIDYANRYHAHDAVRFVASDVTALPADTGSIDLVTSFETIEHLQEPARLVAEFARVLSPGGVLVLSTPNDLGTTDHHEVSLTQHDLDGLLSADFRIVERLGQIAGNDPIEGDLPPGIFAQASFELRPDTLIVIAERR
ncbi:MAG: class I SAM-dependent methyltransferase, partial [Planctomycetota bacterium]